MQFVANMAPVRFLRNISENGDRTEERSRAVERLEDGVEVLGGGKGEDEVNSRAHLFRSTFDCSMSSSVEIRLTIQPFIRES